MLLKFFVLPLVAVVAGMALSRPCCITVPSPALVLTQASDRALVAGFMDSIEQAACHVACHLHYEARPVAKLEGGQCKACLEASHAEFCRILLAAATIADLAQGCAR